MPLGLKGFQKGSLVNLKHGHKTKTSRSPTYNSWITMKQRCTDPKATGYKHYGGRGIWVCHQWKIFENFLKSMGERPKGKTLDRIDNEQGYYPGNCRWATWKQQANNRRK